MVKDCLGFTINVGDVILFPSSGIMEEGKVAVLHEKPGPGCKTITILTKSDYTKRERATDVICKTHAVNMLQEKYPEDFI